MRKYEGMFIIKPDMPKDEHDKTVSSIGDAIAKNGGKVASLELWGRRQLGYAIKKYAEGEYYLCLFEVDPAKIAEMKEIYRLNENILRTLIIVKE